MNNMSSNKLRKISLHSVGSSVKPINKNNFRVSLHLSQKTVDRLENEYGLYFE